MPATGRGPPLDYAQAVRRRWPVWELLAITGLFVVGMLLWLSVPKSIPRVTYNWDICQRNLRALGMRLALYENEYPGQYPQNLTDLIDHSEATDPTAAADLRCPSAPETTSELPYRYMGPAAAATRDARVVVAFEPPANHPQMGGMHVLFADGRVHRINEPLASQVVAELDAGQNPPPSLNGE